MLHHIDLTALHNIPVTYSLKSNLEQYIQYFRASMQKNQQYITTGSIIKVLHLTTPAISLLNLNSSIHYTHLHVQDCINV